MERGCKKIEGVNERIDILIHELGCTKTEFAKGIGVSTAFVSEICSGRKKPGNRTISDIIRVFNVREAWLRDGVGDQIFNVLSRKAQIARFFSDLSYGEDDDFKTRLISALALLDTEEWEVLERVATKLINGTKKEGSD